MKRNKKLAGLLLAAVMVLSMAASVFGASVTIQGDTNGLLTGHTFKAYQIFNGDMSDGKLTNITWGAGIDDAAFLQALKNMTNSEFAQCATAENVADVLSTHQDDDALAKEVAKLALANKKGEGTPLAVGGTNDLHDGYYLIEDTTDVAGRDQVKNASLLQVVDNVTIKVKTDKPTLDKQIKHNETGEWGVVGDNQIGETVEFRTITTVPDATYYDTYTYKITDTMSEGLTSNVKADKTGLTIKINDSEAAVLDPDYYSIEVDGANANKFVLTVDIKAAISAGVLKANDQLYTYYTGVLNENALDYEVGKQDNKAQLEYSNNPDQGGTGRTDEKIVYDWTYKMGVNKVDPEGEALEGARFVLSKSGTLKVEDMKADADGVPEVTESLIPLIKGETGVYTVAPADYEGEVTYVINDKAATIKGLDDAVDYFLYETKAPEQYNKLTAPVQFRISTAYNTEGSAVAEDNPTVTIGTGVEAETLDVLSTNVENKMGSTLPETGGIGTTIFYIVGAILVIGAGVLLITKKRMNVQK